MCCEWGSGSIYDESGDSVEQCSSGKYGDSVSSVPVMSMATMWSIVPDTVMSMATVWSSVPVVSMATMWSIVPDTVMSMATV